MHLLLLALLLTAEDTGSVCLLRAGWEVPKGAMESEATAPGAVTKFTVRIDDADPIDVSAIKGRVDGLSLTQKHKVRVYGDGRLRETFFFTFKGRSQRLTLRYHAFYGSWSLDDAKRECP